MMDLTLPCRDAVFSRAAMETKKTLSRTEGESHARQCCKELNA